MATTGAANPPRRPFPVRWWACGYRDGFTGVGRGKDYFAAATKPETNAYDAGHTAGAIEAARQECHKRLMIACELEPSC